MKTSEMRRMERSAVQRADIQRLFDSLEPVLYSRYCCVVSGSVNEYRLRLGRFKAGMCDAAWCAPCTWAPLMRLV